MKFTRLTCMADKLFEPSYHIYEYSFPRNERRSRENLASIFSRTDYSFIAVKQQDSVVAVLCYWLFEGSRGPFVYLEHIAADQSVRGGGLGSKMLDHLKSLGLPIILEIEPVVDDITQSRLSFYERAGFVLNDYSHTQPAYHADESSLDLRIMSYPQAFEVADYQIFAQSQQATLPLFNL